MLGDTWYHVVVSKVDLGGGSAAEVRVYLDGVEVYANLTLRLPGRPVQRDGAGRNGTANGVGNYSREIAGAIGQFCIFDGALDAAAVQTEYLADLPLYSDPSRGDCGDGTRRPSRAPGGVRRVTDDVVGAVRYGDSCQVS